MEISKIIKELERELALRKRVYPNWVASPTNPLTQAKAEYRIACLEGAINHLKEVHNARRQPDLFGGAGAFTEL